MVLSISIFISLFLYILWKGQIIQKKTLCGCLTLMMFILLAFKSISTGGDTEIYNNSFDKLAKGLSLAETINSAKDIGFSVFEWLIIKANGSFRIVLIFEALCFSIPMGMYFYEYSENPALSYIFLYSFNIFQFALSGLRQSYAIGFVIMAIMCYEKKKYIYSAIFYALAILFHQSAAIVILIPLLEKVFKSRKLLRFSPIVILLCIVFSSRVSSFFLEVVSGLTERTSINMAAGGGLTTCIVVFIIYTIFTISSDNVLITYDNRRIEYAILFLAAFFESMVMYQAVLFRLAFYGLWMVSITVPRIIESDFAEDSKGIATAGAFCVALIMYFGFTMNSVYGGYHFMGL